VSRGREAGEVGGVGEVGEAATEVRNWRIKEVGVEVSLVVEGQKA